MSKFSVIVMQGVSGSGKSTIARKLVEGHSSARIVSADDYHMRDGVYRFDATKLGEAHGQCMRNFVESLQAKVELIVVDNVNSRELSIAPYMALAKAYGYEATILRVICGFDKAHARGTHGASLEQSARWHGDIFTRTLPSWWKVETVDTSADTF